MNTLVNKKARFNYEILEEYTAGIILLGSEVKSIIIGDINFGDSFAYVKDGEIWLKNLHVSKYKNSSYQNHDEMRERKLLLNKKEIRKISRMMDNKGTTIIPTEIFTLRGKIKVKIGICRGKKSWDKKETIKKRDLERESNFRF
jgi:SsrA-binding protein